MKDQKLTGLIIFKIVIIKDYKFIINPFKKIISLRFNNNLKLLNIKFSLDLSKVSFYPNPTVTGLEGTMITKGLINFFWGK